jgi:hypothetical protein
MKNLPFATGSRKITIGNPYVFTFSIHLLGQHNTKYTLNIGFYLFVP